ncbi:nucleosome assembly protein [Lasiosphaeris hirsuta]|uniref:Nucleosome assembly protein n=1 Tax=Lasiosphaeris hirsuta TaxID=260670 RepID=A0AA40AQA0_9PEZI|nr:nucleosome assembly protein [Lasiosphaeris hirsuta]
MATILEESPITYQELADIEREFDDVETEIIRQQVQLTKSLYEKRHAVVSQIPNFWPLVIEQAPPDIDEYIQPSDSALLLSSLSSLSVSHFEVENGGKGDPRSVAIRWEFTENEYFEDSAIEKRFWYRRAKDGWAGLVSEPVDIKWKKGKDLTDGLLTLVKAVWDEEQAAGTNGAKARAKGDKITAKQQALKAKIDGIGLGGLSFFAWFGFRGNRVSAEESQTATQEERQRRQRRKAGEEVSTPASEADSDDSDDDDDLEIFPGGDMLALAIADDLWPGAIKFFTQAQEQDALSDIDFESDEELDDASLADSADESERPAKKRKA